MHVTYLTLTILAVLMNGCAASMNFAGAKSVKVVADKVQVPDRWMVPLGTLLVAGAVGLGLGFAVPALGLTAAIGLVAYLVCALGALVRVRDHSLGGAGTFLVLAVAGLVTDVGDHHHW